MDNFRIDFAKIITKLHLKRPLQDHILRLQHRPLLLPQDELLPLDERQLLPQDELQRQLQRQHVPRRQQRKVILNYDFEMI